MTFVRAIQPLMWTGTTKRQDGVMTCGSCPTHDACVAANRCAQASDEDYFGHTWSLDEREAVEHVKARIAEDGTHDLTGCPRYCRAMCSYKRTIMAMMKDNRWPMDLA